MGKFVFTLFSFGLNEGNVWVIAVVTGRKCGMVVCVLYSDRQGIVIWYTHIVIMKN